MGQRSASNPGGVLTPVYLDNNATTAIDPRVVEEMTRVWTLGPVNASSQHRVGQAARAVLESSLQRIAESLGSDLRPTGGPRMIVTGGGTEANHLALRGLGGPASRLIVSAVEHPSVAATARQMGREGRSVEIIGVDRDGVIDLEELQRVLAGRDDGTTGFQPVAASGRPGRPSYGQCVVSIMSANNETGVIQPIDRVAEVCRDAGALLHVDATQSVGKIAVDLDQMGASAVTITPHKYHGPAGVGLLWLAPGVAIRPAIVGGMQQLGDRPGTEPVSLVAGAAVATQIAAESLQENAAHMLGCRDRLESELRRLAGSAGRELVIFGSAAPRLPNTTSMAIAGVDRQRLLMALDFDGIACSSGSACRSGSSGPSDVLTAMGVEPSLLTAAIRLSVGRDTPSDLMSPVAERIWHHATRMI